MRRRNEMIENHEEIDVIWTGQLPLPPKGHRNPGGWEDGWMEWTIEATETLVIEWADEADFMHKDHRTDLHFPTEFHDYNQGVIITDPMQGWYRRLAILDSCAVRDWDVDEYFGPNDGCEKEKEE